ncbi:hypothetical protein OOK60_17380 [Trichothermofontia sichuanensis B231]|uniref:hypothetical protein n=1 Tax=Trichothermofontia sichuanensis TaxID=3045816 RepID=UPI002247F322|nr:hypothetical protein [Trichothermofontia sichuanensis]UZQ54232.1 hypothetical protein OOK60_17380 [Trichothermofontia sichuanensis B231]
MSLLVRHPIGKTIGTIVLMLLCGGAIAALQLPLLAQLRQRGQTLSLETLQRQDAIEKQRLQVLKHLPAFGFDNLIADWVFLSFLQYFGDDEARAKTGYDLSPEYFEVIVRRDPRFVRGYLFLSQSTSLFAAMPQRTIALMDRGLATLTPQVPPDSYYVWRYRGIDEILFLGDAQAAKRSFSQAAAWASQHPDPESQQVAQLSRNMVGFLAENPRSQSALVGAWSMVLQSAVDDRTRQRAIAQIKALGGTFETDDQGRTIIRFPPEPSSTSKTTPTPRPTPTPDS